MSWVSLFAKSLHQGFPLSYTQDPVTLRLIENHPTAATFSTPIRSNAVSAGCICGWRSPHWEPVTTVYWNNGSFHADPHDVETAHSLWTEHERHSLPLYSPTHLTEALTHLQRAQWRAKLFGGPIPPDLDALFESCAEKLKALAQHPSVLALSVLVPAKPPTDEDLRLLIEKK
ncbi:hypothetical protein NVS55_40245 (plasmid) [Myxococcus stipitatus]|uniref:hypothetical protein n=1 Tax=Myxococcus stipitatus TaxID=83455 RepID=UPI00314510F0